MRRRSLAVPVAVLFLATTARGEARVELPPHDDRSVYDLAGVVTQEDQRTMERSHRDLREKTGVAIAVVTFPRLEGEALEDLLARAGPEWGSEDSPRIAASSSPWRWRSMGSSS